MAEQTLTFNKTSVLFYCDEVWFPLFIGKVNFLSDFWIKSQTFTEGVFMGVSFDF